LQLHRNSRHPKKVLIVGQPRSKAMFISDAKDEEKSLS
jgi:hypothetical protein